MFKKSLKPFLGFLGIIFVLLTIAYISSKITPTNNKVTLIKEYGDIYLKSPTSQDYVKIDNSESEIINQSSIKTDVGKGYVIFPDNSIMSLDENTEVTINYDSGNINIIQTLGKTWHRVNKILGREYNVETNDSLASVRGTRFSVEIIKNTKRSQVYVLENNVYLKMKNKDKSIDLKQGKLAFIENDDITEKVIDSEIYSSEWYQYNEEIDRNINNGVYIINVKEQLNSYIKNREDYLDSENFLKNICSTEFNQSIIKYVEAKFKQGVISEDQKVEMINAIDEVSEVCKSSDNDEIKLKSVKFILEKSGLKVWMRVVYKTYDEKIPNEYIQEINQTINKYTDIQEDGKALCEIYKDKTSFEIINELVKIEEKYKITPSRVEHDYKLPIYAIKYACNDGTISDDEKGYISSTYISEKDN